MKSEYFLTIWRSRHGSRNSLSSALRCRMTSVPRVSFVDRLDGELALAVGLPADALVARARRPCARRTVTLSATMNAE